MSHVVKMWQWGNRDTQQTRRLYRFTRFAPSPCQGEGRQFESGFALHRKHRGKPEKSGFLLAIKLARDGN